MSDLLSNFFGSQAPATGSRIKQNAINAVDQKRIAVIKSAIMKEGDRIRAQYPILQHQDAIGLSILVLSFAGMVACAWAFWQGFMPWYVSVPLTAIFASFTHELEHDLIHYMYFRKNKFMHHLMMAWVWICRPNTISPWARRALHLHHHKHSGTETDLEERGITNGEKWGILRLIMTVDTNLGVVFRAHRIPPKVLLKIVTLGSAVNFPIATAFWAAWHAFLIYWTIYWGAAFAGIEVPWPALISEHIDMFNMAVIAWVAPNILRSFCLNFISSNMHYFGDIEDGNFVQQCMVLNSKWFAIPHLFCFNFGSTHAIHHFVVRDPFYIRQMTAKVAHQVMRENGVRFNDLGAFRRANRWTRQEDLQPQNTVAGLNA